MTSGRRLGLLLLLALTSLVYGVWLAYSPIHIHEAEVLFALHARAIAATLHDANGNFLPLYFHMPAIGENVWFHPMIVYFSAIFLKVLPFSVWSIRLPSVAVGVIDVVLVYLVGLHLFHRRAYALLAAALLAMTPAHFIHSRLEMDYIYPVPFVLLWLWCLLKFDEGERPRLVWAAGLVLGVGFYSYIAAVAFMPLYLAFTWLYLFSKYPRLTVAHLTTTAAFCIPLVFLGMWRFWYPDIFSGTVNRYGITRSGAIVGMLRFLNYNVIQEYVSLYWNFHNPTYLFLVGSPNFQSSTRAAGVFLIPVAVFLVAGVYDVAARERTRAAWLLVAGFLTAPIPAVLVEEPFAIYREMVVLPFVVLLATFGVRRMLDAKTKAWRIAAAAALLAVPLQFGYFVKDYFTDYRLNLYVWFGGNTKGAVDKVLELNAAREVPAIYLSKTIPYAAERWQFYLAQAGREDLFARTRTFDAAADTAEMATGSVVVVPVIDREVKDERMKAPDVRKVAEIVEPFRNGPTSFVLFERR